MRAVVCGDARLIARLPPEAEIVMHPTEDVDVVVDSRRVIELRFDPEMVSQRMQYWLAVDGGDMIAMDVVEDNAAARVLFLAPERTYTLLVEPQADGRLGWLQGMRPGSEYAVRLVAGLRTVVKPDAGADGRCVLVTLEHGALMIAATRVGDSFVAPALPEGTEWTVVATGHRGIRPIRGTARVSAGEVAAVVLE